MNVEKLELANELADKIRSAAQYIESLNNFSQQVADDKICIRSITDVIKSMYSDKILGNAELLELYKMLMALASREHANAVAEFAAL